jgi:hypothetical protein
MVLDGVEGPFDPIGTARVECNDVEPALGPGSLPEVLQQEAIGCAPQPQLLAMVHAGRRATEATRRARPHLHEDHRGAVPHDEVDLAGLSCVAANVRYKVGRPVKRARATRNASTPSA